MMNKFDILRSLLIMPKIYDKKMSDSVTSSASVTTKTMTFRSFIVLRVSACVFDDALQYAHLPGNNHKLFSTRECKHWPPAQHIYVWKTHSKCLKIPYISHKTFQMVMRFSKIIVNSTNKTLNFLSFRPAPRREPVWGWPGLIRRRRTTIQ